MLMIRTAVDAASLIPAVRSQVAQMDKNLPLFDVHTLDNVVTQSAAQQRFQALLLSCFAGMALLLSAIGLYGLLSYLVVQRTLEIGVRIALGARRSDVMRMILGRGLMLAVVGLVIGIVASVALTRFVRGMLFGVQPLDVLTFITVAAVLLLVSLAASTAPAYRAAKLDPMKTLRDQ
jgi:ABC-type antimicrobial peptide transport system permease subunit